MDRSVQAANAERFEEQLSGRGAIGEWIMPIKSSNLLVEILLLSVERIDSEEH